MIWSSYISNASSSLLRLPPELKDRIYYFVHAKWCIHVDYHRHQNLHHERIRLGTCLRAHCDNPYYYLPEVMLPVPFLRTCRQMYHEARNVFYTANVFRIGDPKLGGLFLQRISDYGLALRSVHLNICVAKRNDERQWDNTLHELAENIKTVQHLYIDVKGHLWNGHGEPNSLRTNPSLGKRPFLKGLLALKKLPLKTFEICVDAGHPRFHHLVLPGDYTWTPEQMQAWAQSIQSAVLGKE